MVSSIEKPIPREAQDFHVPDTSHEGFTPEEEQWFEAGNIQEMRVEDGTRSERAIHETREQIGRMGEEGESTPSEDQGTVATQPIHDTQTSRGLSGLREKVGHIAKSIAYPSSARLVKMVAGPTVGSTGVFGLSAALGGPPLLSALASAGILVGGTTFFAGEIIKQIRKRKVGELMSITPVFDKPNAQEQPQMMGELHLLGAKGMKRIREAPKEKQRQIMLAEVAHSLKTLNDHASANDKSVADITTFFGETDVFSQAEIDSLGLKAQEVSIPLWRKPLLEAADKLQKILSGRWNRVAKPRRAKPVLKIQFTKEELARIAESGSIDNILNTYSF